MGALQPGVVVLVRFPFSDLTASKRGPPSCLPTPVVWTGYSVRSPATRMAPKCRADYGDLIRFRRLGS